MGVKGLNQKHRCSQIKLSFHYFYLLDTPVAKMVVNITAVQCQRQYVVLINYTAVPKVTVALKMAKPVHLALIL